jgi:hypothetical protein
MNAVHCFDSDESDDSCLISVQWHICCKAPLERTMDYIKPTEVVTNMIKAGEAKAALGSKRFTYPGNSLRPAGEAILAK